MKLATEFMRLSNERTFMHFKHFFRERFNFLYKTLVQCREKIPETVQKCRMTDKLMTIHY